MSKPQVIINLNVDLDVQAIYKQLKEGESAEIYLDNLNEVVESIREKVSNLSDSKPAKESEPVTSRFKAAVQVNNRISDAIEYINKTIRIANGSTNTEHLKTLKEIKNILLGF